MTDYNDLLSQIPMDELARRLGVDETTAEQAARQALPALLGGMQANAQDPAGAASLRRAVGEHDSRLIDGGVDLDQVDTVDGDKIVSNVFGDNRQQVVNRLSETGGAGTGASDIIGKLLPMLAPLVMAFLAKQAQGSRTGQTSATRDAGGLGDLLGGLLGGSGGQAGAGGLGDLLGGLLGGGKR
ncbi:MAG TPA: DUF937 domain-containing protein [Jiangellaceae bacterium]|nr:DUF937 domain-containing protein [Jiangellaceae bacterium]